MFDLKPIRTALFVPGTRLDRVAKAAASGADVVIIDLEDAVPPAQKTAARDAVARLLVEQECRNIIVRVNGAETEHFNADIMTVASAQILAVITPKVESAADMVLINEALLSAERTKELKAGSLPVIALIESAAGVDNISDITKAKTNPDRLFTVAFGAADYTLDLGIEMTRDGNELLYARSRLPIACRAAGLEPPLDTPFMIDLKDMAALEADSRRAKQMGFQGKLCIHPNQIEVVNRVFTPTPEEIVHAQEVIHAFEKAETEGQGALQINGKFVDFPVVVRARRILQIASSFTNT